MNYSSHYNLNLAEGTDLVNPLTVDVPNYQTIDSTMYANEQAGVGTATELKTGTIHAITRTAPARNIFKFISTSIFNTGDTFTVDGNVVTALYPDQSSLKDRCFITGSEVLCLLNGSQLTVLASYIQNASEVPFNDANVLFSASTVQTAFEQLNANTLPYGTGVTIKSKIDENELHVTPEKTITISETITAGAEVFLGYPGTIAPELAGHNVLGVQLRDVSDGNVHCLYVNSNGLFDRCALTKANLGIKVRFFYND